MTKAWDEIESDPNFLDLPEDQKNKAKEQYFSSVISAKPEFLKLSDDQKNNAKIQFIGKPKESTSYPFGTTGVEKAQDMLMIPGTEIARGFRKGMADVVRPAASVLKSLGTPDEMNLFLKSQIENEHEASKLPDTNPNKSLLVSMANTPFELLGEAPGITAEFAQGEGILKSLGFGQKIAKALSLPETSSAIQGLTQSAEFALVKGMEDLKKGPKQALGGASTGAMVGMSFPIIGSIYNLGKQYGPTVAKKVLEVFTGDPKLADEIMTNPQKYNLNPFKKSPDPNLVLKEGQDRIQSLQKQSEELKFNTKESVNESLRKIEQDQKEALSEVQTGTNRSIENLRLSTKKASEDGVSAINEGLANQFDNTIKIATELRKQKGSAVGDILKSITEKDPMITLPYGKIKTPADEVIKKWETTPGFPFKSEIENNSRTATGKTSNVAPEDLKTYQNFVNDLESKHSQWGYTIDFLQSAKEDAQRLASDYFKSGKTKLGAFYSEISRTVNPAEIVSKNPDLSEKLPELARSNSEFASFKPNHDEILSLISKQDANGNPVPDIGKIGRAVESNDKSLMARIQKAESVLPEEARVLPKVKEAIQKRRDLEDRVYATLKGAQKKAKMELQSLQKEQRRILTYEKVNRRVELFKLNKEEYQKILTQKKALEDEVSFLERQKKAKLHWPELRVNARGTISLDPRDVLSPIAIQGVNAMKGAGAKVTGAIDSSGTLLGEALKNLSKRIMAKKAG